MDFSDKEITNQKAKKYLLEYINQVVPYIDGFFERESKRAQTISHEALDMVRRYADFIGGKRLRGALTKLGYSIFSKDLSNINEVVKLSSIIEIIHAFALMHDDIMDEDDLRRGKPTIHVQYENLHNEKFANSRRKRELFGTSMAINVGDLGPFYANMIVDEVEFDAKLKLKYLGEVSRIISQTVYGQGLDVIFEQQPLPQEDKVMLIHKYKTSFYTIPGPIHYGAILAGVDMSDPRYESVNKYGLPVGIAFQLRDDELGMFSKPEKFGKPIFSDLRQGKNTLLFAKAFENANKEQEEFLNKVFGHPGVNEVDLQRVNQILIDTGSLEYSQKMSLKLVNEGKKYIPEITDNPQYQELLSVLADYVITRES